MEYLYLSLKKTAGLSCSSLLPEGIGSRFYHRPTGTFLGRERSKKEAYKLYSKRMLFRKVMLSFPAALAARIKITVMIIKTAIQNIQIALMIKSSATKR